MPRYERILPLILIALMGLGLILLVERIHALSLIVPLPVENLPWMATSAWEIQTVDDFRGVGYGTSLALDAEGQAHISYYDSQGGNLRHAYNDGTGWITSTVVSTSGIGGYTTLALNVDGHPHIAFYDISLSAMRYVRYDGTEWLTATVVVGENVGRYPSLALDSSGSPHISYYDGRQGNLGYARFDGTAWITTTVDPGAGSEAPNTGLYTSLALDADDRPHISYYDASRERLGYAYVRNNAWMTMTVDSSPQVGWYTSLALDEAGSPRISYYDAANRDLLYARYDGAAWSTVVVDSIGDVGQYTSLAIDGEGRPHISYLGNNVLRYATYDGTTWQLETVDSVGSVGASTALVVTEPAQPHIGYTEATGGDLRFATASRIGFEAHISIAWLILFFLLIVMAVGAESLQRVEDESEAVVVEERRLRLHPTTWILPGLVTLTSFLFLRLLRDVVVRSVGLGVTGLLLFAALLAQHYLGDERPRARQLSRQTLDLLAFLVSFFLYWSIYTLKLRSLISATSIVLLTFLLAYVMLQRLASSGQIFLYAAVTGLCVGEITWPLNYWAIGGLSGGFFLLIIFYTVINLVRHRLRDTLTLRVALEYIAVGLLGSGFIGFYAFWPR